VSGSVNLGDAEEVARLTDEKMQSAVIKAVKADPFTSARSAVDKLIAEDKRVAKVREARKKADEQGLKVIPFEDVEEGLVMYVEATEDYDGVGVKPKDHAKLTCNAVSIDPNGRTIQVCTDPETHFAPVVDLRKDKDAGKADAEAKAGREDAPKDEPKSAEELATERAVAREKAAAKALSDARKGRAEFIVDQLLAGRLPARGDVTERIVWGLMQRAGAAETNLAVKWLGIEIPAPKEGESAWEAPTHHQLLAEYATKNTDNLMRAGLALALAVGEEPLRSEYRTGWTSEDDARHFSFLEARGYKTGSAENKKLGRKAPVKKGASTKAPSKTTAKREPKTGSKRVAVKA